MTRRPRCCLIVLALFAGACKSSEPAHETPTESAPRDAGPADATALDAPPDAGVWPPLAALPIVDPVRVIALPSRPDVPRFDVGGPAIVDDVAVVSSSQLGFAAIDWRRGSVVWSKPAGLHVAPPLAHAGAVVLISDCLSPPELRDTLLGCVRVVAGTGADLSYTAIHGAHLEAFAREPGPQQLWPDGEHAVRWRRGEQAVSVDLVTGVARRAAIAPPPIRVAYRGRTWDIARTDERIVARERGKLAWQTQNPYTSLLGAVHLPELTPTIRVARIAPFAGVSELRLLDIDATGSLHAQTGFPVPALSILGHALDAVGNTALALRMDASLQRDFLVGVAADLAILYVYPLPEVPRADPVGVAVAPDGVLVFHDGDVFTVLPALSSVPTNPGTPRVPSQNPTP